MSRPPTPSQASVGAYPMHHQPQPSPAHSNASTMSQSQSQSQSAGPGLLASLRDSVCERPPANADRAQNSPDFGLFRAGKKLCIRHEKMADSDVSLQLQESLDALPLADRQAINAVWSTFSSSTHPRREIILKGLLTMCCFSQLSLLSTQVHHLIRLDPFALFPREVSLKVLSYLDAFSLGRAVQVSRHWKGLADDDLLWRGMCAQHIERKCTKCGWGLPLLERRRLRLEINSHYESAPLSPTIDHHLHQHHYSHSSAPHGVIDIPSLPPVATSSSSTPPSTGSRTPLAITNDSSASSSGPSSPSRRSHRSKRRSPPSDDDDLDENLTSIHRRRLTNTRHTKRFSPSLSPSVSPPPSARRGPSPPLPTMVSQRPSAPCRTLTRPWKEVYTERLTIERNWRKGRYSVRALRGHTDGVMCLQVLEGERFSGPSCSNGKGKTSNGNGKGKASGEGVLITGSYDRTARVWDLETGEELMVLRGHARGIRALQFDSAILITGSMDHTVKIWNWRTGICIKTLAGHTDGVVSLNYDKNILATGSADSTIKVWNFRTADCFTLRGHRDWVNSVVIWDGTTNPPDLELPSSVSADPNVVAPEIDAGKMLFSGSDDGTIRLWDLNTRECVKIFEGHVGQVQSMRVVIVDREKDDDDDNEQRLRHRKADDVDMTSTYQPNALGVRASHPHHLLPMASDLSLHNRDDPAYPAPHSQGSSYSSTTSSHGSFGGRQQATSPPPRDEKQAILVSASLDNTIKIWDVETGKSKRTLFGHIEGIWGVDVDPLRVVSSSHDRTIKVWEREDGRCSQTLVGHRGAVTCLQLTDTRILSGSDDGEVRIWNFGPQPVAPPAPLV